MLFDELFKGIAVVIDDQVHDTRATISEIIKQIKKHHIPLIKYTDLPEETETLHFRSLSFLLLDWRLNGLEPQETMDGIQLPSGLEKSKIEKNIKFIQILRKFCFCPIFIFTNEDADSIKSILIKKRLYQEGKPNHIFVKSKADLLAEGSVKKEIEQWLEANPTVYVLKKWETQYKKSKAGLFNDFFNMSPSWPTIMWKNFYDDRVNQAQELGELISRNLTTRMSPFDFDKRFIEQCNCAVSPDELNKVLEGERFIKKDQLNCDDIGTGDVFKLSGKYYINIRASCDLIPDRSKTNSSQDDINLYLIKGNNLTQPKKQELYSKKYGNFQENDNNSIVFPLDNKAIDFRFKDLTIKNWAELKDKRIGRLLPPHITKIQHKYALYIKRQGLPRIPSEAIGTRSLASLPWVLTNSRKNLPRADRGARKAISRKRKFRRIK